MNVAIKAVANVHFYDTIKQLFI